MNPQKKYDVFVAGAGFAGVGAAVKAARLGLKTLLIERSDSFGGSAREGMHELLCGLYPSGIPSGEILNQGLSAEMEKKLLARGAEKKEIGKVTVLKYSPEVLQKLFREWVQVEPNLEVFFESSIEKVTVKQQALQEIQIRTGNEKISVQASVFIDCTGSGELIRLSGASYDLAPAAERQLAAYAFPLEGVQNSVGIDTLRIAYRLAKAADEGKIETHLRFTVWLPGPKALRMPVLPSDHGYDIEKISREAELVHQVIQEGVPEFRQSKIGKNAGTIVEREGLRMRGKTTLLEGRVLKAEKTGENSVKSSWPVEFWDQAKGPRYQYLEDGAFYEIPVGCFQSKDISNLFAAGKCVSADSKALSSARMSGTCLAMGEKCAELVHALLNPALNIVELIKKENEKNGQGIAVRQGKRTIRYQELFQAVEELGAALKPSVKKYARVGILVRESADYIALNLGVLSLGGVVVPVPEISSISEIERIIEFMKLEILIYDPVFYNSDRKKTALFSPFEKTKWEITFFETRMEQQEEFESLNPAFIRFTSGTTGESKGVVLSHETIRARTAAADEALKISSEDKVLWVLSMSFHFIVTILLFLRRGACIVLCGHEIPKGMLEGLSVGDITFIYASPVHYQMMTRENFEVSCFREVRMAVSTAMPLLPELAGVFAQKFGFQLTSAYGIIEAGLPFVNVSKDPETLLSVGTPVPGFESRLIEKDGSAGRVQLKGPGFFDAYFSPWRKRKEVLRDGWFETDDIGRLDEKGFLFLLGRKQRVINFMGMKIFPEEIESGLRGYPGVLEAFVDAEPHAVYGQVPRARIVLKESGEKISEDDLRRFCYQRFSRYKVPKNFEFVTSLKKTPSGKVMADQT